ncbi:MAG: hypothetical protein ABIE74_04845 [Pseudomonadota bacterium]
MEDTFSELKAAISRYSPHDSESELSQSAMNLVSFFELLMQIDKERSSAAKANTDKEGKCDEDIRGEHQFCEAL